MPHAGDGFTVVSAMRHTHPDAVTIVLSGYPEMDEAFAVIRSQADEVLVKPIGIASLREIINKRLAAPRLHRTLPTETVATILERNLATTIESWMELVEHDEELTCIPLSLETAEAIFPISSRTSRKHPGVAEPIGAGTHLGAPGGNYRR